MRHWSDMRRLTFHKRQVLIYASIVMIVYVGMECLCYVGLVALGSQGVVYDPLPHRLSQTQADVLKTRLGDTPPLSGHHPISGWSTVPLRHTQEFRINSQGIRAEHDYARGVPPNTIRVSAFGDSFTFGNDVTNDDIWESQLEARDPRFEVLNFGVGAYGLDQAYLRYVQEVSIFVHTSSLLDLCQKTSIAISMCFDRFTALATGTTCIPSLASSSRTTRSCF
jgi:hypothetical protein